MAKMDCVQLSSLLMLALVSVEADVTTFERQFLPTGSQRVHNIFMRRERGLVIGRQTHFAAINIIATLRWRPLAI